jgi:hypothetical protein
MSYYLISVKTGVRASIQYENHNLELVRLFGVLDFLAVYLPKSVTLCVCDVVSDLFHDSNKLDFLKVMKVGWPLPLPMRRSSAIWIRLCSAAVCMT